MIVENRNLPLNKGQSLVEYGLVLALVAIVCIGGLTTFGNSLQGVLSNLAGLMGGNSQQAQASPTTLASQPNPATGSGSSGAQATGASAPLVKACLDTLCANQIQVQPYNAPQVAGSNGVDMVDQYADTLTKVIKQLESDPTTDPSLRSMLTILATDGHSIAQRERVILGMSSGSVTFPEFAAYESQKSKVLDYLAQNPGALPDQLTGVVKVAADNITAQTSDFAGSTDITTGSFSATNINSKFLKAPDNTHGESNKICRSGGDTGQCIQN